MRWLAFGIVVLGGTLTPGGQQEVAPTEHVRLEGQEVVIESGYSLRELVDKLAPAAKRNVLLKPDVDRKIQIYRFALTSPLRVPVANAVVVLEALLMKGSFVLVPPVADDLPWELADTRGADRQEIRTRATFIDPKQIESFANRWLLVTTVVDLKHVNAREVSASLRPFFPDSGLETVTNVGNVNSLLVTGFGPTVASIAKTLRQLDQPEKELELARLNDGFELERLKARIVALEAKVPPTSEKPR